ncbi:hypothetical protein GGI43DRAFT_332740 [Trichoderma evansii]
MRHLRPKVGIGSCLRHQLDPNSSQILRGPAAFFSSLTLLKAHAKASDLAAAAAEKHIHQAVSSSESLYPAVFSQSSILLLPSFSSASAPLASPPSFFYTQTFRSIASRRTTIGCVGVKHAMRRRFRR